MHAVLRTFLVESYGPNGADVPLLYGGSVDAASAPALIAEPNIDGLFVGRRGMDRSRIHRTGPHRRLGLVSPGMDIGPNGAPEG